MVRSLSARRSSSSSHVIAPARPGEQPDWAPRPAWHPPRRAQPRPAVDAPPTALQSPNGPATPTYLLRLDQPELVLRRPPLGPLPPGAHHIRREFQVLS